MDYVIAHVDLSVLYTAAANVVGKNVLKRSKSSAEVEPIFNLLKLQMDGKSFRPRYGIEKLLQ